MYQAYRKWFKNWSWPFSLILDGFLRPSSCRRGRWEESGCETTSYVWQKTATCTWPTTLSSFSTAMSCRSKEFSSCTAQQSFIDLSTRIHGRGWLNCEAKVQVLVVTLPPPPPFFLEVGRKKGGHNSGAIRYVRVKPSSQYDATLMQRNTT